MNGYLRSKCSSEQQLLNELAKLLGAKDVASRKMADVLRALTFFYTSAARGSRIPQSLLSGLCSLLPQLKDKKEITLLKDEHQRIARIALCLLARLIDQFEIQKEVATRLTDSQTMGQEQSDDPAEQVLINFLLTLETAVMTPSGLLLPRQRATLRVYAQLCRVFRKKEQLVKFTTALLQQSPVLAYAENPVDAKGKRHPPPAPAQYGAVTGACHAIRFHTASDEQVFTVDKLAQLAFMTSASTASRHAAKTLLSLLTSPSLNEDRPSNAITVAKAIELYLLKARPQTLLSGDSLTSVYLLRLCGQMYRLPVHQLQQQQNSVANGSGGLNLDLTLPETTSSGTAPKQPSDQNPALQGFFVSNALSAQLFEYLTDVVQAAVTGGPTTTPTVVPAVLLVAIEETLRGTSPEASFRKQPNWGSKCIFELVAAALLLLLPVPQDLARLAYSTVTLHRVCRAVQFVAEHLDATVLELGATQGKVMMIPTYLNQLTLRIRALTEHSNAFVACEALRALVWLLHRCNNSAGLSGNNGDDWVTLFWELETLPFNRIQPERRAAIAWTLFRRCVTTLKSFGYEVEAPLLAGCLRVVLAWFRVRPCVWHATLLTAIWHTALRECLVPLGDAVFLSINELFDYHCAPTDGAAPDCLVVKQSALQFLSHREGGMRYAIRSEAWSRPLVLRLTKQALLETCTSQRMSIRALSQMRDEAKTRDSRQLAQQVDATLSILQRNPRQLRQIGLMNPAGSENQPFSLQDEPFSDVKDLSAAPVTDDDPLSDFRAPEETTTKNTMLEDPFSDAARTQSSTASDVTSWNNAMTTSEMATTESSPFGDFKAPADDLFSASSCGDADNTARFSNTKTEEFVDPSTPSFSNWGGDSTVKEQTQATKAEDSFFGNFSTSESAFAAWGEENASDTQKQGFNTQDEAFGDFPASNASVDSTSWPESQTDHQANKTETNSIVNPTASSKTTTSFDEWNQPSAFPAPVHTEPNSAQPITTTTSEPSFSTDFGAAPTDFSAPAAADFSPASDFGPPAESPAFDSGAEAERRASFGGENAAAEASARSDSFTTDTQPVAGTESTTKTASFSTDFGAAPTDFSAPAAADFSPASDFGPPAESPAFDSGAEAERRASFGGENAAAEASARSDSFTTDTQPVAGTESTTKTASFSTDFGAAPTDFSAPAAADFSPASDFGPPAESPAFDSGAEAERRASFGGENAAAEASARSDSFTTDTQPVAGTESTTELPVIDSNGEGPRNFYAAEARFKPATEPLGASAGEHEVLVVDADSDFLDGEVSKADVLFKPVDELPGAQGLDEIAEYDAAISDKQPTNVNFDDEFDEIFGNASTTPVEPVADADSNTSLSTGDKSTSQPSTGKYDADFDDIFGEVTSGMSGEAASSDDTSMPAENAKKHNSLGEEDHTAFGVEVRTGTPASDFTLS